MRKVLSRGSEVAHYWANKVQSEGKAGNIWFRDSAIYSYGSHFCIAKHIDNGRVLFTTRTYSVTTQQHKSMVRSAARHLELIYVHDPDDTTAANVRHARDEIRHLLHFAQRPRIRQITRDRLRHQALKLAQEANRLIEICPDPLAVPIDTDTIEDVSASIEAYDKAQEVKRQEAHAQHLLDLKGALVKWRQRKILLRTGLHELPVALRLSEDRTQVQTSHGAEIPVVDAHRLWPVIGMVRLLGRDLDLTTTQKVERTVGSYRLNLIRADGSIVVGCHDIPYSEIEMMAKELGLLQGETA